MIKISFPMFDGWNALDTFEQELAVLWVAGTIVIIFALYKMMSS